MFGLDEMKKCECGNKIQQDETQCEWCEFPDPPMYVVRNIGDSVHLYFLGGGYVGVWVSYSESLHAFAPSKEAAQRMLDDFVERNGFARVG